jgi:DUF1365 family protein
MRAVADNPAFGVYQGVVTHARKRPVSHVLRYRIFMLLIDLDQAPDVIGPLRWLSDGRFGLMSFREQDHGDGSDRPLKQQVLKRLADAGLRADGPVRLLTMPRVLGCAFNPISVYFCHRLDGRLAATVYEVSNTFGERHTYVVPANDEPVQRQTADKQFYVSPFMDMAMTYNFVVRPPGETVNLTIEVEDADGWMMIAAFTARRRSLTDENLIAAWLGHPLLILKVIGGIHWEALKLFLKGLRVRRRRPIHRHGTSVGRALSCPAHGEHSHVA